MVAGIGIENDMTPLVETLPDEAELRQRECAARRELDLVRRLRKVVERRDLFLAADAEKQKRNYPATVAG
jgi:hypothetical protein